MSILMEQKLNLFLLQNTLWMLTKPVSITNYNFNFEQFFECQHKWQLPSSLTAIARVGAAEDYAKFYEALQKDGIQLIHTPNEHLKCSELPHWYPLIEDLTPKSVWYAEPPTLNEVSQEFDFPIFMKGARQTSQHKKSLSIIENSEAFGKAIDLYAKDPILYWQQIVCREYIKLRSIHDGDSESIPASYEFRTFWWKGEFVGAGRYWFEVDNYQWNTKEKTKALEIAQEAAQRLKVTFLVVDVAQQKDGKWIIIECNDGQESGYAGLSPISLWKNILAVEQKFQSASKIYY